MDNTLSVFTPGDDASGESEATSNATDKKESCVQRSTAERFQILVENTLAALECAHALSLSSEEQCECQQHIETVQQSARIVSAMKKTRLSGNDTETLIQQQMSQVERVVLDFLGPRLITVLRPQREFHRVTIHDANSYRTTPSKLDLTEEYIGQLQRRSFDRKIKFEDIYAGAPGGGGCLPKSGLLVESTSHYLYEILHHECTKLELRPMITALLRAMHTFKDRERAQRITSTTMDDRHATANLLGKKQ